MFKKQANSRKINNNYITKAIKYLDKINTDLNNSDKINIYIDKIKEQIKNEKFNLKLIINDYELFDKEDRIKILKILNNILDK
jgi:hypothetical protein